MKKEDSLLSIFLIFLRFGLLAWGGPVAQIAMIREDIVEKRKWVTPEKFRRTLAVYQALPGPEAHELCVYFGMIRAGWRGGLLAGLGFMLPGFVLILLLAWAYTVYGAGLMLPLFVGIAPAVTAMIVRASHRLGAHTLVEVSHWYIAFSSVVMTLAGVHFLAVFAICAIAQGMWSAGHRQMALWVGGGLSVIAMAGVFLLPSEAISVHSAASGSLLVEGLKGGLLSFGGAYAAIPFLQDSMVGHYPAITQQVFLDSIALGSVIPAPLIIFGTFLGYMADGFPGAMLMTLGIFFPAFGFTLFGHNALEKLIENRAWHGALDGISAAVVGLLALTAVDIFRQVMTDWPQFFLFAAALFTLYAVQKKWAIPCVIFISGILGYFFVSV